MDLSDAVLEGDALDIVCNLAIVQGTFNRDELAFLKRSGEL